MNKPIILRTVIEIVSCPWFFPVEYINERAARSSLKENDLHV